MSPNRLRVGLLFALLVLVFTILSLIAWDFVRDTFIMPVYYLLWVGDLVLRSIPHWVYLAFLVFVSILIGWNTLDRVRERRIPTSHEGGETQGDTRYAYWRNLSDSLHSSSFARGTFASEARKLVLSILAYQQGVETSEIASMVTSGALPLPEAIRHLIEHKSIQGMEPSQSRAESVKGRLRRLFLNVRTSNNSRAEVGVSEVVEFIEHLLEVHHGRDEPQSGH